MGACQSCDNCDRSQEFNIDDVTACEENIII